MAREREHISQAQVNENLKALEHRLKRRLHEFLREHPEFGGNMMHTNFAGVDFPRKVGCSFILWYRYNHKKHKNRHHSIIGSGHLSSEAHLTEISSKELRFISSCVVDLIEEGAEMLFEGLYQGMVVYRVVPKDLPQKFMYGKDSNA